MFIKPILTSFLECFRKPRINSQLVAQQVAQQYATPPPPKKEKKEKVEKQDKDKDVSPSVTKKNANKKTKCVPGNGTGCTLQAGQGSCKCLFCCPPFQTKVRSPERPSERSEQRAVCKHHDQDQRREPQLEVREPSPSPPRARGPGGRVRGPSAVASPRRGVCWQRGATPWRGVGVLTAPPVLLLSGLG